MGTCATCKYWADEDEHLGSEATSIRMRECKRAGMRWEIMDAANSGERFPPDGSTDEQDSAWTERRVKALLDAGFYVQDAEHYQAHLITGSDFGCVKHEQRHLSTDAPIESPLAFDEQVNISGGGM